MGFWFTGFINLPKGIILSRCSTGYPIVSLALDEGYLIALDPQANIYIFK